MLISSRHGGIERLPENLTAGWMGERLSAAQASHDETVSNNVVTLECSYEGQDETGLNSHSVPC
jgi:hypothetical protein